MIPKIASRGIFCLFLAQASWAMDTSPYKPGQKLTEEQAEELKNRFSSREIQDWKAAPSQSSIDGRPDADLVHHGIQVLNKTVTTIGPKVADTSKRYSGNSLNCSSCHIKGADGLPGTKKYGIPFTNVANDYPNFRSRSMTVGTAADRVNGCMTRSMGVNGKPLPEDSREMKAMLAYFAWLSEGTDKSKAMEGTGLPKVELPARAASIDNGKVVFKQVCQVCHGDNGLGMQTPDYSKTGVYQFPPLAGPDSFDDGAGMSRIITATRFIYGNMPLGVSYDKPTLSADDAFDVAGYILSLERENRGGRDKDFPNPKFRPADYPVPAYFNADAEALKRAKYGPFGK